MRRPVVALTLAVAVLVAGAGLADGAFTTHRTTPQEFTAADSFRPPERKDLELDSRTNDGGASGSQIQLGLRLRNSGGAGIDLDDVTIRYWYTGNGSTAPVSACYYAQLGCDRVILGITETPGALDGADHYLEVGFRNGRLGAGETAVLDQLAIRDQRGAVFDQHDDHSFLDRGEFTSNSRVTVYLRGELVWGTEPSDLPDVEALSVKYANGDQDPHDGAIKPFLQVVNTGTVPIELGRVTLRYWFTRDGGSEQLLGFCDYAEIGCAAVTESFGTLTPRPGADTYLQVGFKSQVLPVGDSTGSVQLRVHKSDYSPFDETDDHSWDTNTTFQTRTEVTAYVDGHLVWGVEP